VLGVRCKPRWIELDFPQVTQAIPLCLIVKVPAIRMPALAGGGDRKLAHFASKLDNCHEAISAGAVPFPGAGLRTRSEEASEPQTDEAHLNTRLGIVERLGDVA
jgi:hypothetical protein